MQYILFGIKRRADRNANENANENANQALV
jgi:hypothetical protein